MFFSFYLGKYILTKIWKPKSSLERTAQTARNTPAFGLDQRPALADSHSWLCLHHDGAQPHMWEHPNNSKLRAQHLQTATPFPLPWA